MLKLYYSPFACSLAPHILLRETEQKFELVKVDLKTKQSAEGDFRKVNPKGYVPTLGLANGEVLTEGAVIIQYICEQKPERKLLPAAGTMEHYRAIEWLNFIATEMHKGVGALFNPALTEDGRKTTIEGLQWKFEFLDQHFSKNQYLMGANYSAPDAYLFNVLQWPAFVKLDISKYTFIQDFLGRVSARPAVKATFEAEKSQH